MYWSRLLKTAALGGNAQNYDKALKAFSSDYFGDEKFVQAQLYGIKRHLILIFTPRLGI